MVFIKEGEAHSDLPSDMSKASKRKSAVAEIEVDLAAPEPPSKRARRALKKGKSLRVKADSDTDDGNDSERNQSGAEKPERKAKAQHGVWVGNIPFTVTFKEMRQWLVEKSGGAITEESITRINIPASKHGGGKDKKERQNKGFAYVDFNEEAPKVAAVALTETSMGGRNVLIKDSKSFDGRPEKPKEEPAQEGITENENANRKIFVGNLSFATTQDDVWENFHKCGDIDWVKVATFEDTGKCKGFGWVKFKEAQAAESAARGFVKIKEEIETEDDFKEKEEEGR